MLHGLERSLLKNMVVGVTQGYRKEMEIVGIGFSAKLDGGALLLEVGFANTIKFEIPKGIKVEVMQATNPGRMAISGSRQARRRPVRRARARREAARAVSGQGHQVRDRSHSPQGRQGVRRHRRIK